MAGIRLTRPLIIGLLGLTGSLWGQVPLPPANLVTVPTAGTPQRGMFEVELLMQRDGGVLGRLGVGFSDRFSLGLSYSVQRFIGDDTISFQPLPEAQLKYRVIDESFSLPAIAIGLDSQGRGEFWEATIDSANGNPQIAMARYDVKAIGLYLVVSKNWQIFGNFGSHLGLSKNVWESDDVENGLNLFVGFDKDIAPGLGVFLEYNAALDDNGYEAKITRDKLKELTVGKGKGYLNAGIRWHLASNFYMEVDLNDILVNKGGGVQYFSRELKVVYSEIF
ncbi:MAG: hypothetical protein IH971_03565 [Candidatus Marinimicrobia bacterium]|nr:hypothetical protein [Candidatus Neomarinimicrobiota bacterium]